MTKKKIARAVLLRGGSGRGYEVGYGKPPKHSRFKKGRSGNPKGRPKGIRNFATDLKDTLKTTVKVMREGRPCKISTQKAALLRLREKALSGDPRALNMLLGLARTLDHEELPLRETLSGDDMALLGIYNARILSGAADAATKSGSLPEASAEGSEAGEKASRRPERDGRGPKPGRRIKRYRPQLKRGGASETS